MKLRMTNYELRIPFAFAAGNSPFQIRYSKFRHAFTLVELILVMALLVVAISLVAPRMSSFIRSRALASEARRLVALAHAGQDRAVSEGMPIMLWIDEKQNG